MSLADFLPAFLTISAIGLIISLCTEQSQIVAKTRSVFIGKIATGYMSAMRIMIVNRFGAILYVFFIGLAIDLGIENQTLLIVPIIASVAVLGYNLLLVANRAKILRFVESDKEPSLPKIIILVGCRYAFASFLATLFNILGLTLPFLLSNTFPEYRLSLANSGFLLNAFFTMINVLVIETRYAAIVDEGSHEDAYRFSVAIFVMRALATVTAILTFVAILAVM